MNVSLMLFLRKMWRVIFDIIAPESYGSYLELLSGICTISWIHPSWARLLTSNMDFTPNMDFTGDSCQGKQKQKQKTAPHRQKVLMSCGWAWAEKTSLARILSLHWLEGNETTVEEKWFSSRMVTGNGSPPLTFRKGRRSKVGIMLFFLILPFSLLWNQLELTIFNFLFDINF